MRFVEGASLQDLIAAAPEGLPPGRAARIVARVADALDAAHARGLVHRDVKPANVLIADPDGEEHVYLVGLRPQRPRRRRRGAATASGPGRSAYLAPEQIRGEALDARTDVYALGCVLFHALTGRPPFPAGDEQAALDGAPRGAGPRRPRRWCPACRRRSTTSCGGRWPSAPRTASRAPASSAGPPSPRATTWRCCSRPDERAAAEALAARLREAEVLPLLAVAGEARARRGHPGVGRVRRARGPRAASATGPARASPPPARSPCATARSGWCSCSCPGAPGSRRPEPGLPGRPALGRPARRRRRRDGGRRPRPRPPRRRRPRGPGADGRGRVALPRPGGLPRGGRRPLLRPRAGRRAPGRAPAHRRASSP